MAVIVTCVDRNGLTQLAEVRRTLDAISAFSRRVQGRQKDGNQKCDDSDDDEKFNQRETNGAVFSIAQLQT